MEWNKLLSNPMLLEGMASLGKGIVGGSPDSAATWLGDFAISRIKASRHANLLSKFLGGIMESGGDMKMGGGKMTLNMPTGSEFVPPGQEGNVSATQGGVMGQTPPVQGGSALGGLNEGAIGALVQMMMGGGGSGGLNPTSGFPSISATDLAGLTPEDINSVVQLQQGQKALQLQEFRDLANTALGAEGVKTDRMGIQQRAEASAIKHWEYLDKNAPVSLPDGTSTPRAQFDAQPKDYQLYVFEYADAKARGVEREMPPFSIWRRYQDPESVEKRWMFFKQHPEAYAPSLKWEQESRPQTIVNLDMTKGKAAAQSEGSALGKDVGRLKASDYMEKLVGDLTKDQQYQMDFSAVMGKKDKETQVTLDAIERKLEQESGTKIVDMDRKGNVAIWTVELEDGTRVERRYTIK